MPKHKNKNSQKRKQHPVIGPAPFLFKKHITFSDLVAVAGGSSGGENVTLLNGNGYSDSGT
jgi:hypothetical protein